MDRSTPTYNPGRSINIGMEERRSITRSSRGRLEQRILVERGVYTIVKYRDLKTGEEIGGKWKIYLKGPGGLRGYLMIRLKDGDRYLAIPDEDVDPETYVYNEAEDREEPLFPD